VSIRGVDLEVSTWRYRLDLCCKRVVDSSRKLRLLMQDVRELQGASIADEVEGFSISQLDLRVALVEQSGFSKPRLDPSSDVDGAQSGFSKPRLDLSSDWMRELRARTIS